MTDEQKLIDRIKQGERSAFRELVENNKQAVYAICFRLSGNHTDADELSQVVFIKFFKSIPLFRQEAGVQSWLYKIAVNSFIDQKRKKVDKIMHLFSQEETDEGTFEQTIISEKSDPEQATDASIIQAHIDQAMKKLSPKEKSAFILKHYHGHTIKEIAGAINTSEGTVKSLLFRGVKKLQQALSFYRPELGLEEK